jgi:hypothetical protein
VWITTSPKEKRSSKNDSGQRESEESDKLKTALSTTFRRNKNPIKRNLGFGQLLQMKTLRLTSGKNTMLFCQNQATG